MSIKISDSMFIGFVHLGESSRSITLYYTSHVSDGLRPLESARRSMRLR